MSTTKAALKAALTQPTDEVEVEDTNPRLREVAGRLHHFRDKEEAVNTSILRLRWWANRPETDPIFRRLVLEVARKLEAAADAMDNVDTRGWTKAQREAFNHVRKELRR